MIKIWVDDERPMPEGYQGQAKSVCECMEILGEERNNDTLPQYGGQGDNILLDLDHDAGIYRNCGGDFINILNWLASPEGQDYWGWNGQQDEQHICVRFHSANPVGVKNMRAIVESCPWIEEVK